MTTAKQIITIEVTVDIERFPLPETWDWSELARQLGGRASVRLFAAGQPQFEPGQRGDAACDTQTSDAMGVS